jgi:hypothetical protein
VQRRAGGLPGLERQRRPVRILLCHARPPFDPCGRFPAGACPT